MLELKRHNPLPGDPVLPRSFDFSLERDQQCASIEEFDGFARQHPLWDILFGLPGLDDVEHGAIVRWLEAGAPYEGVPPLPADVQRQVREWEAFLNGDSLKERLASLASEADYRALADRYAVRRTRADFWTHSDALHEAYARSAPAEAGVLDYNRLENR